MPGRALPEVTIIGVGPQTIDFSMEQSQPLRDALPSLVDLVERMGASLAAHCPLSSS